MTNVWLKKRQQKKFTFEIAKNAIFRIGPVDITIVEKNTRGHQIRLDLGDTGNVDVVELSNIAKDINKGKDRAYYGRIRTFFKGKESNVLKMESLTSLQINFVGTHLHLLVYYV